MRLIDERIQSSALLTQYLCGITSYRLNRMEVARFQMTVWGVTDGN